MATTWSMTGGRSAKAVCTTGTESAPSNPAQASGTATLVSVAAGDTLTLAGVTFTASATDGTGQNFLQTGTDTVDAAALAAAINRYSQQTHCSATSATNVVTITALDYGTGGNAITLAETGTTITVSGATLANGVEPVGAILSDVGGLVVLAEAPAAATVAAGNLRCYLLNDLTNVWSRAPDLDTALSATASRGQGFPGLQVVASRGRIAFLPDGVTAASGLTVYINCSPSSSTSIGGTV